MADSTSAQARAVSDRISRLTKYLDHIKSRVGSTIPERHKNRPEAYKAWLALEVKRTTKKLESLRGV